MQIVLALIEDNGKPQNQHMACSWDCKHKQGHSMSYGHVFCFLLFFLALVMDFDATQAIALDDLDDETDEETEENERKPVSIHQTH